jgi:uncharacterized protein YlxW (UPF0749 family)
MVLIQRQNKGVLIGGVGMKRMRFQLSIGIIFIILGFMLSIQLKSTIHTMSINKVRQVKDLSSEIETLKRQKVDLIAERQEYQDKVEAYEEYVAEESRTLKIIKNEINKLKLVTGLTDVQGEGIIMTIKPKPSSRLDTVNTLPISSSDFIKIINDLYSVGAEAISINNERITGITHIKEVSKGILINNNLYNSIQTFIIKVIGNQNKLSDLYNMPNVVVSDLKCSGFEVLIRVENIVRIFKYNSINNNK